MAITPPQHFNHDQTERKEWSNLTAVIHLLSIHHTQIMVVLALRNIKDERHVPFFFFFLVLSYNLHIDKAHGTGKCHGNFKATYVELYMDTAKV